MNEPGDLSGDGSLLHHYGTNFDGISNMWDHVNKTYGPAHELVTLYYASDEVDYPLHYQLWQPPDWDKVAHHMRRLGLQVNEAQWQGRHQSKKKWYNYISGRYRNKVGKHNELRQSYETKIHLAEKLLRRYLKQPGALRLPVIMDSGFASNHFCRLLSEELGLNYVADIRATQVVLSGQDERVQLRQFIEQLKQAHLKALADGETQQAKFKKTGYTYRKEKKIVYAYCGVHRLGSYDKKQKIIIQYYDEQLKGEPRISITNKLDWYPSQILRARRMRWPVETYHQQSKAQGLESYQVRNEKAIQTHIAFVIVAFTMLTKASRDEELLKQLRQRIQTEADRTLPFMRRLLQGSALWTVAQHIFLAAQQGKSLEETMAPLMNTFT